VGPEKKRNSWVKKKRETRGRVDGQPNEKKREVTCDKKPCIEKQERREVSRGIEDPGRLTGKGIGQGRKRKVPGGGEVEITWKKSQENTASPGKPK